MLKRKASFREGVDTLVGSNSVFKGNIESEGTVRVDGKVIGDIKVEGDVYIGNGAAVEGNVDAGNVYLAGMIKGNIVAKGLLKILSTAKLYGDIKINSFVADEGALFQGKCEMIDGTESEKPPEKHRRNYKKSTVLEDIYEDSHSAGTDA
ncbi:MAG TPA: polymer-forming cytoskeletal protein [Clostridiales bacterium]|nr:polymer-forming cytoskeletal protein [Clostridiales bacterium]